VRAIWFQQLPREFFVRDTSVGDVSRIPAISAVGDNFLIPISHPPKTSVRQV